MNTESAIFSSPKSIDSGRTQALTERLYPGDPDFETNNPYAGKDLSSFSGLEEDEESSCYIAKEMGLDHQANVALEQRIKLFQETQQKASIRYLEHSGTRSSTYDSCLFYMNGWTLDKNELYLTEQSRRMNGGIFIRWNGKGIAVNPGHRFLENFHSQGLHIRDINMVIVTGEQADCYADVKEIYELNYQLNKMSQELHVINYYFHQKAFQELSRFLKPHFKQERNSIHSLELFLDSPDVEKIDLDSEITLNYFLINSIEAPSSFPESKEERIGRSLSGLGIKLELRSNSSDRSLVRIGYITNASWNPLMAHHLGTCDLLITGFGNTSSNDYNKISYNTDCLGYYGTYTLLEEVSPKVLLCGEFAGREGDIRLETVQKLRKEQCNNLGRSSRPLPHVLPADSGLILNLKTLSIKCSVNEGWINPSEIKAIKTMDAFGKLEYLAPACFF